MAHQLADETLAQILDGVLRVTWEDLSSCDHRVSPFSTRLISSSTYLLVCKRWMRVATPFLYKTVVLRSVAQARALDRVLQKNSEFGGLILQLRVEGHLGASIPKIFEAASKLEDLCLALRQNVKTGGKDFKPTCAAFSLVSPRRCIVSNLYPVQSGNGKTVDDALIAAMKNWSNMHTLVVSGQVNLLLRSMRGAEMPNLAHFVIADCYGEAIEPLLVSLVRRPTTSTVQIRVNGRNTVVGFRNLLEGDPENYEELSRKICFVDWFTGAHEPLEGSSSEHWIKFYND